MSESEQTYGPGQGPGPRATDEAELSGLLSSHAFGALATNKSSGYPHLATMIYKWDPEQRVIRFSTVAGRIKVRHLQKDPRAALYVASDDFLSFAVAEGDAEISPETVEPGDEVGLELLAMSPGFERPQDRAAYLQQMVDDHRLVIRLRVSRLYGVALDAS